ncbi:MULTISPECIES: Hsp33 family molecular chaperone HslO [unclassified Fusibacter]|uniref:Hsp33 family molecular chaperone HslO n=1 Tax=unclassified Fusibacter TaxID=2624464 RepID=UPI001012A26D|nr:MULTISPECIES: Hsp33 family molecular chaperone HslO [unclassified Fusibacter]MCK8058696.1 Hsp33 family molecular chaperone HslO [Fusibacter sp. A2]NPE21770.1 Hsp33 family molecular chaperone HslO [Fusibacter sp. A1]RXV61344.1 Hsp33 family molecular chaperone HslO [Fusibacter sp. A1]
MGKYLRVLAGKAKDLSISLSDSTDVVYEAWKIHNTTPVATAALGRTLTATHLMGTFIKDEKASVSLQISGSAVLKRIYAYADGAGFLKGYVSDPNIPLMVKDNGKLDVSGAVGVHGSLMVSRDTGYGEPFVGQSDLVSGEIAEDLAYYYAHSEQQPSVISLGVFVDSEGVPTAAGGLMIQTLPDVSEESLSSLEKRLPMIRPMSEMIGEGMSLEAIVEEILGDIPFTIMVENTFEYRCDCSRDKVERALITIGINELKSILNEDGQTELSCHFCGKKYLYNSSDLKWIIKELEQGAK